MTIASSKRKVFAIMFKDLERWNVSSFFRIRWKWPREVIRPLSDALERKNEVVDRKRFPLDQLCLVTLHFDGEIVPRDLQRNGSFKGKLFFAENGEVIYSKIDVRNGAIGVVPANMPRIAVSSEYPVYHVRPDVALPDYIKLLFRTSIFRQQINSMISGASGRKRVQPLDLEQVKVPLLPLQMQRAIVEYWQKAQKAAADIGIRYERLIEEIDHEILKKIGLNLKPPTERKGAFALLWGHLERWDTFFYRLDFTDLENQLSRLKCMLLGDLLNFISRPWEPHDFPEGIFRYVEISSVTKENGIIGCRNVRIDNAPSRATTLLRTGDVILATTRPYLGAFAIVTPEFDGSVCSSGFAVADRLKTDNADKDYVLLFLKSSAGLRQLERRMTGGLYPAIVQTELEQTLVPVPPLELQHEIVDMVGNHLERITKERKTVEENKAQAFRVLEEMILGIRPVPH
jgi:type I restriction enzyme S subunit